MKLHRHEQPKRLLVGLLVRLRLPEYFKFIKLFIFIRKSKIKSVLKANL